MSFRAHMMLAGQEYLADLLKRHEYNITQAAKEAGYSRTSFYCLLRKYNVMPKRTRVHGAFDMRLFLHGKVNGSNKHNCA